METVKTGCAVTCIPTDTFGGYDHTIECMWEHFMSCTGYWKYPEDVREALKLAYEHGFDAGKDKG